MSTPSKIAIIGGGLGGLTLGRILQTRGIPFTIYERETSRNTRQQGGSLDLHTESGQRALQDAGLFDKFEALARYEGQDMKIMDKNGKEWLNEVTDENEKGRPEIDRSALRDMLIDSLEPENVKWGYNLKSITLKTDQQRHHLLHFENYPDPVSVDLVVGADGTWSKIRPYLSSTTPSYTGVTFVEVHLSDVDSKLPVLASLVGRGSLLAVQDNKGIIAQRNSGQRVRVYFALRVSKEWYETKATAASSDLRAELLERFADWSSDLQDLLNKCDDSFGLVIRPIFAFPDDHTWTHKDGITILGDAAHVMSPFAGEGANLAMLDAAELALAIAEKRDLEGWEKEMRKRSREAAKESRENMEMFIHPDAPAVAMERMQMLMAGEGAPVEAVPTVPA